MRDLLVNLVLVLAARRGWFDRCSRCDEWRRPVVLLGCGHTLCSRCHLDDFCVMCATAEAWAALARA